MRIQKFDALRDRENVFCYLVNCQVLTDKIQCGCAYFRGGISGKLTLFDVYSTEVLSILIPLQVRDIATFALLTPMAPLDYLEIEIYEENTIRQD